MGTLNDGENALLSQESVERINQIYSPSPIKSQKKIPKLKKNDERGFVYIISNRLLLQKGLVKIGYAKNYNRRMYSHNSSSPYDFEYLALFCCLNYEELEQKIHHDYRKYKFNREFFRLNQTDLRDLCNAYEEVLYAKDNNVIKKLSKRVTYSSAVEYETRIKQLQTRVNNLELHKSSEWERKRSLEEKNQQLQEENQQLQEENQQLQHIPVKIKINPELPNKLSSLKTELQSKEDTIRELKYINQSLKNDIKDREYWIDWYKKEKEFYENQFFETLYNNTNQYIEGCKSMELLYSDYWELHSFKQTHSADVRKLFKGIKPYFLENWINKCANYLRGL